MNIKATTLIPFLFVWLWSTGFVGARFGLPYTEPFLILAARLVLVVLAFGLLAYILKSARLNRKQIAVQLLVGILLHGFYLGGVFYAISIGTPAGIAAIIVGIQPILSAVINWVLFRSHISKRQCAGLVLGFSGLLAVIFGSSEILTSDFGMLGLGACLLSLLGITFSTLIQRHYGAGTPLVTGAMWQNVSAAGLMLLATFVLETQTYQPTWQLGAALIWMVGPLSVLSIMLLMYMIKTGEMAKVTSYFYLVPPVAVIQTWFLFGETLSLLSMVGCGVVVMGVALVVRETR